MSESPLGLTVFMPCLRPRATSRHGVRDDGARQRSHEERLEDGPLEGEPDCVLEAQVDGLREAEGGDDGGGDENADPVASDAVHCRADNLTPARGDEEIVRARQRLPAATAPVANPRGTFLPLVHEDSDARPN